MTAPVPLGYVVSHLKVGGTQQHIVEVLRRLDRSRFAPVVYLLRGEGALVDEVRRLGVPVEDLAIRGTLTGPRSLVRLARFARLLRRHGTRVLHCYLPEASFAGAVAGTAAGVPAVIVSKRSLEPRANMKRAILFRWANALADVVLANAREVARHAVAVEGADARKIRVIPNGIDLGRYAGADRAAPPPPGPPVIGAVLRLEPVKGPHVFVDVAARVAAEHPEVRFVLVGDGRLRSSVEADVARRGLTDRVALLGERKDIEALLPRMSIFLLPSLIEGMSMALLEAMAAARPIVATAVGGNVELIRDGETGLLVPPGDAPAMAAAAQQLVRDPALAARLGGAARRLVLAEHDADRMVEQMEALYAELLDGGARAAVPARVAVASPHVDD
jgi:glycosyltransferase involved in cell wall biosynthesis